VATDLSKVGSLIQKVGWLGGVGLVIYLGENTGNAFINDVWAAAKTASPLAAMFAILVWADERRERREAQKQCNERTVDFIQATNLQAIASDKIGSGVRELSGVIKAISQRRTERQRR
jgi:hypothetical protein